MEVYIYFNGLYDYKKDVGGWGTILVCGDHIKELFGVIDNASQYRACLTALLEGLKALKKEGLQLHICSFSTSVISPLQNITSLSKKEENENKPCRDIWLQIIDILGRYSFHAEWITKESDNPYSIRSIEIAKHYKNER